ncbi:putative DDE superfamily endonuclease [Paratrimastix pyriformis]|uniref:DDE superfamily endonuclease n=1 Tax=Paratrimastix pyriformis TaxID=342808 RepID=A0ABQ8U8G4_9EUKA|nr:putative DDE superfamily endonuclease [Paratrimastix pyriformis]
MFIFLSFCREYPSRRRMGITYGLSATRATAAILRFLDAMEGHFPLEWNRRYEGGPGRGVLHQCWTLLDSTSFRIERPCRHEALYFSGHHRQHELKYEAIVNWLGRFVYLSAPYAGSSHDMAIYRATEVNFRLDPGELILADRAYLGPAAAPKVACGYRNPSTPAERELNREIGQSRILIENCFGRLKRSWRILSDRWRHSISTLHPKDGRILACQCGYTTTSGVQDQFETGKEVTKTSLPQHLFTFLAACPSHLARKAPVKDFDARQTCIRGPNISGHPNRAATGRP